MKTITFFCYGLLITAAVQAQIIHVPGDFPTIHQAIDTADNGDTVLVSPGTYMENINFNGKNITVSSLFLTTKDTAYISQTIIDGDSAGSVVVFNHGEDSTTLLSGFTITNGYEPTNFGGGIYSSDGSNPTLKQLRILNNKASGGGGIYCANSSPLIENVVLSNNWADWDGGGMLLEQTSRAVINHVKIIHNIADNGHGGGIYMENSSPLLQDVEIKDNGSSCHYWPSVGKGEGGGLFCNGSTPILKNVSIINNSADLGIGGGICCYYSNMIFENVRIMNNTASTGGGIFFSVSGASFDPVNRCNIYGNEALYFNDLYSDSLIHIKVDTFTVLYPTTFYAGPTGNFNFDILHGITGQTDADLYISPHGNDLNSGLTSAEPLKTIHHAFTIIRADAVNRHSIYLLDGVYSRSSNNEFFPVILPDYIRLSGSAAQKVILNAEGIGRVLELNYNKESFVADLTINGGYGRGYGGGILCQSSNATIRNVIIDSNRRYHYTEFYSFGGGIDCENSIVNMQNVLITNNIADYGSGISCQVNSTCFLHNVTISGNHSDFNGSGIAIGDNSKLYLLNSILRNNIPQEIYLFGYDSLNECTVSYANIRDGKDSIVNTGNGKVYWLEGNIDEDPMFAGNGEHPYSLMTGSPCINTGIPDTTGLNLPLTDISGNPRIFGGRIDMGAYEWNNVGFDNKEITNYELRIMNWPDPFIGSTIFSYTLKESSQVTLQIYNSFGQLVSEPVNSIQSKGEQQVHWDAGNLPTGMYYYRLQAGSKVGCGKMMKW